MFLHTARPPTVHLDVIFWYASYTVCQKLQEFIIRFTLQVQKSDNHVFLADFGLSRVISSSHLLGTKTIQSGTPGFQAPEQLRAEAIDVGADVYAFGALIIELFGEEPVWKGLTPYLKVALNDVFPDYSRLPLNICSMCMKPKHERSIIGHVLRSLLFLSK